MDTPAGQQCAKGEDKYDAMALIAGPIAGLRREQLAGLAHIFRQIAKDERELCAKLADKAADYASERELAETPLVKTLDEQQLIEVAAALRHQAQYLAINIRSRES